MKLTVKEVLEKLKEMPPDAKVVFQGNIYSESKKRSRDNEPDYITTLGYVYNVFQVKNTVVIDCAITEQE